VVATTELGGALGLSLLALVLPVVALVVVVTMIAVVYWILRRLSGRRSVAEVRNA
jgi:flagellar biogenesis protein FliO